MVDYEGDLPGILPPIIECMVALGSSLLEPLANSPPPKVKVYGTTSAVVWEKNSPLAGLEPTSRPGVYNPVELPTELRVLFPFPERESFELLTIDSEVLRL